MRILELLLPHVNNDKDLSKNNTRYIDALRTRMNSYVDKISDPKTSIKSKEFLKTKLKDDYTRYRSALTEFSKKTNKLTELFSGNKNWEWGVESKNEAIAYFKINDKFYTFNAYSSNNGVWDIEFYLTQPPTPTDILTRHKYGITGTGSSVTVLSTIVDIMKSFLDRYISHISALTFSADEPSRRKLYSAMITRLLPDWDVKFKNNVFVVTPLYSQDVLTESVNKLPLTDDDFKTVKELMSSRIPAIVAHIYLQDVIDDDEFTSLIKELEEKDPDIDIRPFIVEWIKRVMPDQLYRFTGDTPTYKQKLGTLSPIHGYDTHMYRGTNEPITGNAYGSK